MPRLRGLFLKQLSALLCRSNSCGSSPPLLLCFVLRYLSSFYSRFALSDSLPAGEDNEDLEESEDLSGSFTSAVFPKSIPMNVFSSSFFCSILTGCAAGWACGSSG